MKILIIGYGNSSKEHIKTILSITKEVSITCITSFSEQNKTDKRVRFLNRSDLKPRSLSNDKYNLTLICSSTKNHKDDIYSFASISDLIIVEKPLSYSLATSKNISDRLGAKNANAYVFLQRRLHPIINELRNYINNRQLGRPLTVNIDILKYKTNHNCIENSLNLGIHYIDLVFFLLSIEKWDILDKKKHQKTSLLNNILTSHSLLNDDIMCRTQFNFATKCGLKKGIIEIYFQGGIIKIEDTKIIISRQDIENNSYRCKEQLVNLTIPLNSYRNAWESILIKSDQNCQLSSILDCVNAEKFIHSLAGN